MMIASMPRGRAFFLAILLSISVLSYWSFDSHIRPAFSNAASGFYPPSPKAPASHKDDTTLGNDGASILLVSAFFPLSKSKHTMNDYNTWFSLFLKPITTPIYFFTTPEMEPMIRQLRGDLPITINTTYASAFETAPLLGLEDKYEEMWRRDRERRIHSPELYSVWAAKPFFLDEGLKNAKGRFKYAFWTDAGSFRSPHQYTAWPDAQRVEEVWREGSRETGTNADELFFVPTRGTPHGSMQYWNEGMGPVDNEISEGSFFGGSASTVRWWRKIYYTYHDAYLRQGVFVGKDQPLINAIMLLNPKRVISVWASDPAPQLPAGEHGVAKRAAASPVGLCGASWYYYEFFLASASERAAMASQWDSEWSSMLTKFRPWKGAWWSGDLAAEGRGPCRVTRVMAMEKFFRRALGDGWNAPPSQIYH